MLKKSDLNLVKYDDPILHVPPKTFDFSGEIDAELLSNLLLDRMKELGGVGLSANQVGLSLSVFAMGIGDVSLVVFNPKIVKYSEEEVSLPEGCLSYPGVYVLVKRPINIEVEYQNAKGETETRKFSGLSSRVFQHEYDHMLGLTMKEKVSKLKWDLAFNRMIKRTKKIIKANVQKQLLNIARQM